MSDRYFHFEITGLNTLSDDEQAEVINKIGDALDPVIGDEWSASFDFNYDINNLGISDHEAFRRVYECLVNAAGLFRGECDIKNAQKEYMYGIYAVMEDIAYNAGKEDEYNALFFGNMEKSEEKE